ncbi:MAG: glutathione S-transferase family protein [Hyphomicrobiales bacterium]|nr:glutathione S-transferase family protein [Hyphomicrobiales bacterium]
MPDPVLVIANKRYSSWSLRPWMLLTQFDLPFREIVVRMGEPDTRARMLEYSPTGKVPALVDGPAVVWDSLAICEYVADSNPQLAIWPHAAQARAMARSIAAEMHSSFQALRQQCPMVWDRPRQAPLFTPETLVDIARIENIWRIARERFADGGPFLFGAFSAADAMYAPVVSRFDRYAAPVADDTKAYMQAMKQSRAWKKWDEGARAEPWRIEKYETA